MATGTFATAFGCIDGRATIPTTNFLRQLLHVDFIDFVSAPGPDKVLLQASPAEVESIKQSLLVSVNAHHSQTIAIAAHHGCAGYPATREEHQASVRQCAQLVESWNLGVRVLGLWVNDSWQLEIVCDSQAPLRKSA
jgi:hypothetical protein